MNNSNDFMMYLHEDRVQRTRNQQPWIGMESSIGKPSFQSITSPFARVRNTISTWVDGAKNRDVNQS